MDQINKFRTLIYLIRIYTKRLSIIFWTEVPGSAYFCWWLTLFVEGKYDWIFLKVINQSVNYPFIFLSKEESDFP